MRPVFTANTLGDMIRKSNNKTVALWFKATGSVALMRTPDGQAYEVEIRPASLAKFTPFLRYTKKKGRRA
jgi:hypothetical protein